MSSDTLPTIVDDICYGSLRLNLSGPAHKPRGHACEGDEPDTYVIGKNLYGKVMRGTKNNLVVGNAGSKRQSFEVNFQHTKTCIGEGFLALIAGSEALMVLVHEGAESLQTAFGRISVPGDTVISACSRQGTCCVMVSTGEGRIDLLHYTKTTGELVATSRKPVVGLEPGSSCIKIWSSGTSDFLLLVRVPVPGGNNSVARFYRINSNDHTLVLVVCPEELAPTTLLTVACSSRAHNVLLHYTDRVVVVSMNGHVLYSIKDDQLSELGGKGFDQVAMDMVTGSFAVRKGNQMVYMKLACAMELSSGSLVEMINAEKEARQADTVLVSVAKQLAGNMSRMDSPDRGFNTVQLSSNTLNGLCSFPVPVLDTLTAMIKRNPHKQESPIVVFRGSIVVGIALMTHIHPPGMESYSVLEWNKGMILLAKEERSYVLHHVTTYVTVKWGRKLVITGLLPVDSATMYTSGADANSDATRVVWISPSPMWMSWNESTIVATSQVPVLPAYQRHLLREEAASVYQLTVKRGHTGMTVEDFTRETDKVLSIGSLYNRIEMMNDIIKCCFGKIDTARCHLKSGVQVTFRHSLSPGSQILLKKLYCDLRRTMIDEQYKAESMSETQYLPVWNNPPVVRKDDRVTLYHLWIMQRLYGVRFMIVRMTKDRKLVCVRASKRDSRWTPLFDELGVLDVRGREQHQITDCPYMFLLEPNQPILHYKILGYEASRSLFYGAFKTNLPEEARNKRHPRGNGRCFD